MHSLELSRISTEIIGILGVIHLSDLIFCQLHIVKFMVIVIKVVLSRYLLLVFFIREFIMHSRLLLLPHCLHSWGKSHHRMSMPRHLMNRDLSSLLLFDKLSLIFMHGRRKSSLLDIYLCSLIGIEMIRNA